MRVPLLLLLLTAYLAGCGYKGPLYLPKPQAQKPGALVTPEPPPERPVPADAASPPKSP